MSKELWPPMNTDKRGLKTRFLSVFICVHRRPKSIFPRLLGAQLVKDK